MNLKLSWELFSPTVLKLHKSFVEGPSTMALGFYEKFRADKVWFRV